MELDSPEQTIKYEIFTSIPPTIQLFQRIKDHVAQIERDDQLNLCYGSVKFKNIEEEWSIIYMLYQLSKLEHDLVIKIQDEDGDVLLIEAAEHLPAWLESSKSKDRAFVHRGKLHIIPEHVNLKTLRSNYKLPPVQAAAQFIRDNDALTVASSTIQDAIKEQLSGMPDKKAWLEKKFNLLDEIISSFPSSSKDTEKFKGNLSLANIVAMPDEQISPISSKTSSHASSLSSSSWLTEQEVEDEDVQDEDRGENKG